MKWLPLLLFMCSFNAFAQYPFEKYPAIKYDTATIKSVKSKYDQGFKAVAIYKNYKFIFLGERLPDSSNILLYYKKHIIKRINHSADMRVLFLQNPIYIADIDGNGLKDFKIDMGNDGSGAAADYEHKIYLFQQKKNRFKKLSFVDLFSNTERDFNHDGNFEIIGQVYKRYKNHSYYIFDLYNFIGGKILNVSQKYNYPIAVQNLWVPTYKITNKIPKSLLKHFSLLFPEDYSNDN